MNKRTFITSTTPTSINLPVKIQSVTVINSTDADCVITADNGDTFPCPKQVIATWDMPPTERVTAALVTGRTVGTCNIIVSDQPAGNSTSQLSTLYTPFALYSDFTLLTPVTGFSAPVPQTQKFAHVKIICSIRTTGTPAVASSGLFMICNGDLGAQYDYTFLRANNSGVTSSEAFGASNPGFYCGQMPGDSAPANSFSHHEIDCSDFQNTAKAKAFDVVSSCKSGNAVGGIWNEKISCFYRPAVAFQSYQFASGAAGQNFLGGCRFSVYALGGN